MSIVDFYNEPCKNFDKDNFDFSFSRNFIPKSSLLHSGEREVTIDCEKKEEEKLLQNHLSKADVETIEKCMTSCRVQTGCRRLQRIMESDPKIGRELYKKMKGSIVELSFHPFGNYFVQKLLECLEEYQYKEILEMFSKDFMNIALNPFGTRVIQKLLECIHNNSFLIQAFDAFFFNSQIMKIIMNPNATHILIKYFYFADEEKRNKIINFFKINILLISTHKHSCYAIQKCIELMEDPEKKRELIYLIALNSDKLFNDPCGNYLIQFVLDFNCPEANQIITQKYLENFIENSTSKCSSNVFRKCLSHCSEDIKLMIVRKTCNVITVRKLLFNMYGNYGKYNILINIVLQDIIKTSPRPYRSMFIQMIVPMLKELNKVQNGNVIVYNIMKKFPDTLKSWGVIRN